MDEGYIVNGYFLFMSEFLKQIHKDAPFISNGDHGKEGLKGDKLETNGEIQVLGGNIIVLHIHGYNHVTKE